MINIVILGGGFAGIRAASILRNRSNIKLTLIDRNNFHTFTPALYEVATSEEPQKNVTIPFKEIFGDSVEIREGTVDRIDTKNKIVFVNKTEYLYDYLIFCLGSESSDFGIPGIKDYGLALKTLEDAISIKNALKTARKIIVGGGGFSGTEIACELSTHKTNLDLTLIAGSQILKELGDGVSKLAKERLQLGNVRLVLGEHIEIVTKESVELTGGRKFPYDAFIWTGGVKSNDLLGKIEVDENLRVKNFQNIFAAGDTVSPGVARRAIKMGKIASENILRDIKGRSLLPYSYRSIGYLVPLGSHFATFAMGKYHISGVPAYILQQLIMFKYLLEILPFFKALKRFIRFEKNLKKA